MALAWWRWMEGSAFQSRLEIRALSPRSRLCEYAAGPNIWRDPGRKRNAGQDRRVKIGMKWGQGKGWKMLKERCLSYKTKESRRGGTHKSEIRRWEKVHPLPVSVFYSPLSRHLTVSTLRNTESSKSVMENAWKLYLVKIFKQYSILKIFKIQNFQFQNFNKKDFNKHCHSKFF